MGGVDVGVDHGHEHVGVAVGRRPGLGGADVHEVRLAVDPVGGAAVERQGAAGEAPLVDRRRVGAGRGPDGHVGRHQRIGVGAGKFGGGEAEVLLHRGHRPVLLQAPRRLRSLALGDVDPELSRSYPPAATAADGGGDGVLVVTGLGHPHDEVVVGVGRLLAGRFDRLGLRPALPDRPSSDAMAGTSPAPASSPTRAGRARRGGARCALQPRSGEPR